MGSLPRITDINAIRLIPIDPDSQQHMDELYRQRILCGWNEWKLETWSKQIKAGTKTFFWIMPTDPADFPMPDDEPLNLDQAKTGPRAPDPSFRPIGHVALDWIDDGGDPSLADKAEKRITLATFFILISQQGRGLGTVIMRHLEDMARSPQFDAKEITLNTLSPLEAEDPEWYRKQGMTMPERVRLNQRWYERLGYVPFKTEPRYPSKTVDGEDFFTRAVFMRKSLS